MEKLSFTLDHDITLRGNKTINGEEETYYVYITIPLYQEEQVSTIDEVINYMKEHSITEIECKLGSKIGINDISKIKLVNNQIQFVEKTPAVSRMSLASNNVSTYIDSTVEINDSVIKPGIDIMGLVEIAKYIHSVTPFKSSIKVSAGGSFTLKGNSKALVIPEGHLTSAKVKVSGSTEEKEVTVTQSLINSKSEETTYVIDTNSTIYLYR